MLINKQNCFRSFKYFFNWRGVLLGLLWAFCTESAAAQTLPVGTPQLEDHYRRQQLLGVIDSNISFAVRPLPLRIDSVAEDSRKPVFKLLPLSLQQQVNTDHPYGWNDGLMIPARGYQALVSGGIFAKLGPISIQLSPEAVYAGNGKFNGFPVEFPPSLWAGYYSYYNLTDLPERFGNSAYSQVSWGQSSIRLNIGPMSLGLSNEHLWWGPGVRNSLLMSNSAPGFKHFTLNTTRPVKTFIGFIEAQVIGGRLDGSGYSPPLPSFDGSGIYSPKQDDWRYLSAVNLSYQPKWVRGLFLGLTRSFQAYRSELRNVGDYFPLFTPYQKVNTHDGDPFGRDQLTSVYMRWLLPAAKAELYGEYAVNDHAFNFRDLVMSPEHARSYLFGLRKILPFKGRKNEYVLVGIELTQMEQAIDRLVRGAGAFYMHGEVRHGYTHQGQVLGAGIGPGSNLQSLEVSWFRDLKKLGLRIERQDQNNDLYNILIGDDDLKGQWVDLSAAALAEWDYGNFLFNANLTSIYSVNYQFQSGLNGLPKQNVFNVSARFGMTYRF